MDILIKDLDIPKYGDILYLAIDSDCNVVKNESIGFRKYEAIPVPEHGRLIDANKILEQSVIDTPIGKVVYPFSIDSAPTVLEASR